MEHLDVVVVGAGLSGIGAGHHLQTKCPWAAYAIFEARGAIGGTWDLFRYPGIRSDSDMYTLGYPFRPWPHDNAIADGDEIRDYIQETARAEGIDKKVRFHHRIISAEWSSKEARYHVRAQRTDTDEFIALTCNFLFSCSGYYRYDKGYTPRFRGMEQFAGRIVHPQHWPEDLDCDDKTIIVIGSGATAVTLIPSLAGQAAHVTMLQRSPSYIAARPSQSRVAPLFAKLLPPKRAGDATRWTHALLGQAFYEYCKWRPQSAKRLLLKGVSDQLPKGYDVSTHFQPSYDPWDQRLCLAPQGDLFKAIRQGKASVVTDAIETFTPKGVRLQSGNELPADIIVTATGLELLFLGGIELSVDGERLDLSQRLTYKGMMLEGVPNLALAVGYTNASWTLKCDLICDYVARMLNLMRERGMRQCTAHNQGSAASSEPLLGLSSGYVQRSAHQFPRQGPHTPWRVHQNYLRDYRSMKSSEILDDSMRLSNPAP